MKGVTSFLNPGVVGHRRLEGPQQLERLCQLYAALRLFTNI